MNWSGPSEFFAMGGYALYVWGAYGVTAACLLTDPTPAARRPRGARGGAGHDPPHAGGADDGPR